MLSGPLLGRRGKDHDRRPAKTHPYAKQVPRHHVQLDVTFLKPLSQDGRATRRYDFTAMDDATRIRGPQGLPTT